MRCTCCCWYIQCILLLFLPLLFHSALSHPLSVTLCLSHTMSLSHTLSPLLYISLALCLMPQTRLIESPVCAFSESDFQLDLKGVQVMDALLAKLRRPSGGVV